MKPIYSVIPALAIVMSSCSTELEVNAPYSDSPVVYGLLNAADSVHYIKINKTFLGQQDAYVMAQYRDSVEYGDIFDVYIDEKDGRVFTLERTEVTNKSGIDEYGNEGPFPSPSQYLYRFNTQGAPLDPEKEYALKIKNRNTGEEITSSTELVHDFMVSKPSNGFDLVGFAASGSLPTDYEIKYSSAANGRRYAIFMTMTYSEVNISTGDSVTKYISWDLGEQTSKRLTGNESMIRKVKGEEFYSKLISTIPVLDGNTRRYLYKMDFTFWAAGEQLHLYMEVNEPSTGIVQEKPVYTNIENGLGIFGSRYNKDVNNKYFTRQTADLMSDSPNSHDLYGYRFSHYYGQSALGEPFQFVDLY